MLMRTLFAVLFALVATLGFAQNNEAALKKLKALEKNYLSAKAALAKKPKDKKVRDQFVTAGVKYGHESMTSPALDARVKYKQALKVYREVLKIDPKNPVAKPESELIVSIYKQMGRPIPE